LLSTTQIKEETLLAILLLNTEKPGPQSKILIDLVSYSAGLVFSSFEAESSALVDGLEWCHSHLKSCYFQSTLFLIDSKSALTLLSSTPAFLLPKSFWDIWDLSDYFSSRVALSFQWVPGHAGLLEKNGQTHLPKPEQHSPLLMFPAPWLQLLQRLVTLTTLCGDEIFLTTFFPARFLRFPRRNWLFPILSTVNCLDFAATVTAFFCPNGRRILHAAPADTLCTI